MATLQGNRDLKEKLDKHSVRAELLDGEIREVSPFSLQTLQPLQKETGNAELARFAGSSGDRPSEVLNMAVSIEEAGKRLENMQRFIASYMKEGEDYGVIPGAGTKKVLFKSGAEKLCDVFALAKEIQISHRVEDFEKGFFHYEVKAILRNKSSRQIEAEGLGSCNSKERKYIKQDPFSVNNTILKMAKKRALVDAVLSATRSSGIFTQDLEDLKDNAKEEDSPEEREELQKKVSYLLLHRSALGWDKRKAAHFTAEITGKDSLKDLHSQDLKALLTAGKKELRLKVLEDL